MWQAGRAAEKGGLTPRTLDRVNATEMVSVAMSGRTEAAWKGRRARFRRASQLQWAISRRQIGLLARQPTPGRYRGQRRSWFRGWILKADPKGKQGSRGSAIRRVDVESERRSQRDAVVQHYMPRQACQYRRAGSSGGRSRGPDELPSSNLGLGKLDWLDLVVLTARPANDTSGRRGGTTKQCTASQNRTDMVSDSDKMGWCLLSRGRQGGWSGCFGDIAACLSLVWQQSGSLDNRRVQPRQQDNKTPWDSVGAESLSR